MKEDLKKIFEVKKILNQYKVNIDGTINWKETSEKLAEELYNLSNKKKQLIKKLI